MPETPYAGAPYRDPSRSVSDRANDLLGRMTIDEKLAQLGCLWITALVSGDRFDADRAAAAMPHGIGEVTRIGASTGLRPAGSAALMNRVQRVAIERTRLGIPLVVHEESTGGLCARDATVFPQGLALASTWDTGLVADVADVIRRQMLAVGARHTLAPVLDVARDPRWGRVEETYGEDPVLTGTIGTAYVQGLQTGDLANGVVATGKHFLGYALPEGGMNQAPVQLGPRELREVYAEPFAAAIRDADLASVMNSYSSVDGLPCAGGRSLLTGLLREELGFGGVVVADYFSVSMLADHHRTAADKGEAAVQALSAGLDMELPTVDCFGEPLRRAVEQGELGTDVVDAAVRRVLEMKLRLGLFETPYVDEGCAPAVYDTPAQRALARRAVSGSVILLANRDGLLPLDPGQRRIAVIGPGADDPRLLQGDYHYPAHLELVYEEPDDDPGASKGAPAGAEYIPEGGGDFRPGPHYTPHVTPFAAVTQAAGEGCKVVHVAGCEVTGDDTRGIEEASSVAAGSDVAIVVVAGRSGLRPACTVGEARDAVDLRLTGRQHDLVEAVAATGTPTVLVVMSGRVHTLDGLAERVGALVLMWPPGEEGGNGLADVLFGRSEPGGRLPVSMPRHVGQVPVHYRHRAGGGMSMFFGDYTDSLTSPEFAFGHGLSYTSFSYGDLSVSHGGTGDEIRVELEVTNTGARPGSDVVQLYARDRVASTVRPDLQLVGFTRVVMQPGETRTVWFEVHPSRLAFYDEEMRFVVEPGELTLAAGASSADLRSRRRISLDGGTRVLRQREVVATRSGSGPSGDRLSGDRLSGGQGVARP